MKRITIVNIEGDFIVKVKHQKIEEKEEEMDPMDGKKNG